MTGSLESWSETRALEDSLEQLTFTGTTKIKHEEMINRFSEDVKGNVSKHAVCVMNYMSFLFPDEWAGLP